jgi:hypothetical protein
VSTLEILEDLEEKAEVDELLNWWNWYDHHCYVYIVQLMVDLILHSQVFPSHVKHIQGVTKQSALAKLKEKWSVLAAHRSNVSSS